MGPSAPSQHQLGGGLARHRRSVGRTEEESVLKSMLKWRNEISQPRKTVEYFLLEWVYLPFARMGTVFLKEHFDAQIIIAADMEEKWATVIKQRYPTMHLKPGAPLKTCCGS
jgi:hypothetical protein